MLSWNPDEINYPIVPLPHGSLLATSAIVSEIKSDEPLIPRATFELMLSGRFPLIRIPEGKAWILKPKIVQNFLQLMTQTNLLDPQKWYDLLASCSLSANLYVMDRYGERYKVIDVEIDPGGETGVLVLQHLGRRNRQGYFKVDIQDGYGNMLPFIVYK